MTAEVESGANSFSDLKPKMQLKGTVKKIELFGAFIDIGVGRDGLVHISQVRKEHTDSLENLLSVGQEVSVWVQNVDPKAKRVDLTLIEPYAVEWDELKVGEVHTGKVVRIESYGAFVDIGAERPGMVHVREMAAGYVKHPSEIVKLGAEVEVKVSSVNRKKRQIDFSMKALEVEDLEALEEDQEPVQSAMEVALRSAMDEPSPVAGDNQRKKKKREAKADREDFLQRTLEKHRSE